MRILTLLAAAAALAYTVQPAEAGAIRYLGHQIKGGSQEAANATVGAGETVGKTTAGAVGSGANATKKGATAVGGGAAEVGAATGNAAKAGAGAVKNGAVATAKGAEAAPGAVGHGVKVGSNKVWKAIW